MSIKLMVRLLYGLAGLVVVMATLTVAAVQFVDWNAYRGTIATMASERLRLSVDLDGDVGVSLLPSPSFQVAEVSVRPLSGDGEVVTKADLIAVRLSMSALLAGALEIDSLRLEGIDLTLVENEEGAWALRGWPESDGDTSGGDDATVTLSDFRISGGSVRFVRANGRSYQLNRLDATLSGSLPLGPMSWEATAALAGEPLVLDGRLRPIDGGAGFGLLVNAEFAASRWRVSGRTGNATPFVGRLEAGGASLAGFVSALGKAEGSGFALEGADLPFALDMQLSEAMGLQRLVGREIQVGNSAGELDADILMEDGALPNITGRFALNVLDLTELQGVAWQSGEVEAPQDAPPFNGLPFKGSVDLAVETVRTNKGLLQQISASLDTDAQSLRLSRLQALMPGGSQITLSGRVADLGLPRFAGMLKAESGNLRDFLATAGVALPAGMPAGRLSTASLGSRVEVSQTGWVLEDVRARIDTLEMRGSLAGDMTTTVPTRAALAFEALNLDAYLSADAPTTLPSEAGRSAGAPSGATPGAAAQQTVPGLGARLAGFLSGFGETGITLDLSAPEIVWQGHAVEDVSLQGRMSAGSLVVEALSFRQQDGVWTARGQVTRQGEAWRTDLDLGIEGWTPTVLHALAPATDPLVAVLAGPSSGLLTASGRVSGPLGKAVVAGRVEGGGGSVAASGTLDLDTPSFGALELQAQVVAADIKPLIASSVLKGGLPTELALSLSRPAAGAAYDARVTGAVMEGQMLAEMTLKHAGLWSGRMTYAHSDSRAVLGMLGLEGGTAAGLAGPLSVALAVEQDTTGLKATDIDTSVGPARLTGAVSRAPDGRILGALTLADFTLGQQQTSARPPDTRATAVSGSRAQTPDSLKTLEADVALALSNVTLVGQRITAPSARFTATAGSLRLDLGNGARLEDGVLTGRIDVTAGADLDWHVSLQADRIDAARAFGAAGFSGAFTGPSQLQVELSGRGTGGRATRASLAGEASVSLNGGQLNFMDAPALLASVGRAPSIRSFLGGISGMLRQGQSQTRAIEASARLADGVALVDRFRAEGVWGTLDLDGQINLTDYLINMKGALALNEPPGAPPIDVRYSGDLTNPQSAFTSALFERFVFAGIDRRQRSALSSQQTDGARPASSPGQAVFGLFNNALQALQKKQAAEKEKAETEAGDDDGGL